ncbi:MAG TPA: methyltransferase domain-containing protein [Vicinamibacteria bacterium]|nr:methyltransferase domain-containing protein [Vicinamibacteria bacterium]
MRPGESLELTIEKGVYRGLGLGRAEGQVVFLPRGLPGDRWRARIASVERGYLRAEPEALLEPGAGRRSSPCAFVPACGGCCYQELGYEEQLRLKEAVLRESLRRAGAPWDGPIGMRASPETGWRTRATFHVEMAGRGASVGLHAEGSRTVVDLDRCLQVSDAMNGVLEALRRGLARRPAFAARVADIVLAEGREGGGVVACFEGRLGLDDAPDALAVSDTPGLSGVGLRVGSRAAGRFVLLRGSPHVVSVVLGAPLRSHVLSFFQGNRFLVDALAQHVVDVLPAGGTVLDLFAGVGLFALSLARRAERVLGIEAAPTAVDDARFNAAAAGLRQVRFVQADVARGLPIGAPDPGERVVLDPPRSGAGTAVVRAVAGREPAAVAYVSCDPPTLGRDLRTFAERGYRVGRLDAFDLFPDTFHLEAVALLTRV